MARRRAICLFILTFAPCVTAFAQDDDYIAPPTASSADESAQDSTDEAIAAPAAPAAATTSSAAVAVPAGARGERPTTDLGSVAVTGTAIARTDSATALPVTTYEAKQLREQGITSTEQFLNQVAGNNSSFGAGRGTGTENTGGTTFANLRGLGPNKTLILLNGRRLAVNALDGGATDLNNIPFAAIDHVEILRDGASALYGTDAIGGVINFITKKNLDGGNVNLQYTTPTRDGGGTSQDLSATFGKGDFDKDGWNVMGTLSYQRQNAINALDRDFVVPLDPRAGSTSINTFPGTYVQDGTGVSGNTAAPGCNVFGLVQAGSSCRENFTALGGSQVVQKYDRPSFFGRGALKLNDKNSVSLSYLWTRTKTDSLAAPAPSSSAFLGQKIQVNPGTAFFPGAGVVPAPNNPAFDPDAPVTLNYRAVPLGPRVTQGTNEYHRVVLDFTGRFLDGFHYDTAFTYNQSTSDIDLVSGYYNQNDGPDSFQGLLDKGRFNPFSPNPSQAQINALKGLQTYGNVESDKTRAYVWDGKIDHEIGDWFGAGQSALALGAQYRHETLTANVDKRLALRSPSYGAAPSKVDEDRDVEGVFGELNVPILDNLELDAQARYDNYSDVGDTVNPKVSLRYQPLEQLTLRASYSEGFHAPTLYDLYQPEIRTFTGAALDDPILCAGGSPSQGGVQNRDCGNQFFAIQGGNKDLEPEKSKSWSAGFVLQPVQYVSLTADFFAVELSQQIDNLDPTYIFNNYNQYAGLFDRDDNTRAINSFQNKKQNLGKTELNGEDVQLNVRVPSDYGTFSLTMQGTYINKYDTQVAKNSEYIDNVSNYELRQNIFRWKHNVTLGWNDGPVALGVVNHYSSGYQDYDGLSNPHVHDYVTWDTYGSYSFDNGIQLTLGSNNVFDADPPFSVQPDFGNAGYNANYSDSVGRTVYGRLNYNF